MSTLNVDKVDPSTGTALEIGSSGDTITIPSGATIVNSGTATGFGAALTGSTNNTIVTVTGANAIQGESTLTYDGTNLDMGDSKKIRLGDGNDLEIYHNGSHSFIADNGGGSLIIDTNNGSEVDINSGGNAEFMGRFIKDGAVKLYHNGSEKLETTSTGADVTGGLGVGTAKDLGVGIHVRTSDTGGDVHSGADQLVLEANTDMGMTMLASTSGECFINFGDSGDNDIGQMSYHHSSNHMAFKTNASEAMRIDSNGDVGIGTTDPTDPLHVVESASHEIARFHCTNTGNGATLFKIKCDNTTGGDYVSFNIDKAGYSQLNIEGDGDVKNTNNSYGAISDERIKKDITDANSQWEDIKALKVKNYKLKADDTAPTQLGVIAQDLETAGMNGLVKESKPDEGNARIHSDFGTIEAGTEDNGATPIKDDDGNITGYEDVFTEGQKVKAVKYSVLYMKAIKALQESMERIEQLEAKVTALENA